MTAPDRTDPVELFDCPSCGLMERVASERRDCLLCGRGPLPTVRYRLDQDQPEPAA